jgi:hypothetical protein
MREYQEFLNEYGPTSNTTGPSQDNDNSNQEPDPAEIQKKADQQQIQKNTNQISQQLNQQGAAQSLNKVKFTDVMNKLDDKPDTDLNAQDLKQMEPMAVATSKALQNPQTAMQMKQLINKSDMMDKLKQKKLQQQQDLVNTNTQGVGQ